MTLRFLRGLLAVGFLGLAGCSGDPGSDAAEEGPVASVTQAIACNSAIYDSCSEWAGDSITIRTYRCKPVAPRSDFLLEKPHTVAVCPVESGFVVVGGGGQILRDEAAPLGGGIRYSNITNGDPATNSWTIEGWSFASNTNTFGVLPYAVGLKLSGHTAAQLREILWSHKGQTVLGVQAQATVTINPNRILVGGGFETHGNGVLTPNFPVDAYATKMLGGTWRVNANSPEGDAGYVRAFAWSLPQCPPLWASCFNTYVLTTDSSTGTSNRTAFNVNPTQAHGVIFSGGISSSWDRYLYSMFPLTVDNVAYGGSMAATEDWATSVSGYTRTYSFLISR
jgi:hypothetical protein